MGRLKIFVMVVVLSLTVGCTSTLHYQTTGLNAVQIGWTKSQFLQYWAPGPLIVTPIMRASQLQQDGQIVEVFTLPLVETGYWPPIEYWFVFKGDRLVQWGRPEDWQQVSGRYEIAFNPSPSIR